MMTQMTRDEMIKWVEENETCASCDIPDWLLELSKDHEDIEGATEFYRDLMAVAHLRSVTKENEQMTFDLDDLKQEVVMFLNNLDFLLDLEIMRRKGDFFQMYVDNLFALDFASEVNILKSTSPETVSLDELLQEFSDGEDEREEED